MAELSPGSIFAGHRIEGIAGRGGFGVVYRATHIHLDHVVALKLISSGRAGDDTFRQRFKSESRIAVSIRHPNVVAVHNAGEEDGLLFVTMDFIDGTDLRGLLTREGRLKPREAVDVVSQVAAALDAAHAKGLVHRDIKPGNVLIDEKGGGRHVYLTDFGLSKQMDATGGVTATGAFVGTLDYVAPEQIKGDRLDARTDVYALGCVMFELLAGDVPYAGQQEKVAKIYAHLQEQPPELSDAAPEVPAELSEVVWRAMSKEPDDRHPSAGDFARGAQAALEGRRPTEPERNVGVGAAAPTQSFDALAGAVAGAAAVPETVETPPPGAPSRDSEAGTAEVPPPEAEVTPEASRPGATVAVPPPPPRAPEASTQEVARPEKRGGKVLLGALALAAAAGGAYAAFGTGGDRAPEGAAGDDGGGGGGGAVQELATVAANPVGIAVSGDRVFVSSRAGEQLAILDAESGEAAADPVELEGTGEQVAIDEDGDVWVAVGRGDGSTGFVRRYSPEGDLEAELATGIEPRGIAVGEDFAWTANNGGGTVTQVTAREQGDPLFLAANEPVGTRTVGEEPARMALGNPDGKGSNLARGLWVTNAASGTVSRITEEGAAVSTVERVTGGPRGIAVVDEGLVDDVEEPFVWVAAQESGQLHRIAPEPEPVAGGTAGVVEETIDIGGDCSEPTTLAVGFGSLWATCGDSQNVARIDLETGGVRETFDDVGPDPEGIFVDDQGVWVTSNGEDPESDDGIVSFIDAG